MSDRKPLILVVEDDPSVQNLLRVLLEAEGYEVIHAEDGLEGLVKIELQHPSLVILDLMMPNVTGDRVIDEIRGDVRLNRVPLIVAVSALAVQNLFYSLSVALFILSGLAVLLLSFPLTSGIRLLSLVSLGVVIAFTLAGFIIFHLRWKCLSCSSTR